MPAYLSSEAHSILKSVSYLLSKFFFCISACMQLSFIAPSFLFSFCHGIAYISGCLSCPCHIRDFVSRADHIYFFMLQLLQKDASKRLGSGPGGSEEIKKHKWFKCINWKKLDARQIQPSFRPTVSDKLCIDNFEEKWTKTPLSDSPVASPVGHDCAFRGFSFFRLPAPLLQEI